MQQDDCQKWCWHVDGTTKRGCASTQLDQVVDFAAFLMRLCQQLTFSPLSTRIKDAGIAICQSRGYIMSILQGPEVGWRGLATWVHRNKKNVYTRIKDAGVAIRHSRGYIISILQGLEMGWKGLPTGAVLANGLKTHLKKHTFFIFFADPWPRPGPAKKDEKS